MSVGEKQRGRGEGGREEKRRGEVTYFHEATLGEVDVEDEYLEWVSWGGLGGGGGWRVEGGFVTMMVGWLVG